MRRGSGGWRSTGSSGWCGRNGITGAGARGGLTRVCIVRSQAGNGNAVSRFGIRMAGGCIEAGSGTWSHSCYSVPVGYSQAALA